MPYRLAIAQYCMSESICPYNDIYDIRRKPPCQPVSLQIFILVNPSLPYYNVSNGILSDIYFLTNPFLLKYYPEHTLNLGSLH